MKGTQDTMEGGHKVIVEMPENLLLYDFFARLENLEKIVHNQGKTAKKQNRFVKKLTLVVSVVVIALLFMAGLLAVVLYKDSSCTCRAGYPVDLERAEGPGASGARAGGPPGEDGGPPGVGDGKPPGSDPDHRVPTGIDGRLFKHRENDVKRIKRSADDGSQSGSVFHGRVFNNAGNDDVISTDDVDRNRLRHVAGRHWLRRLRRDVEEHYEDNDVLMVMRAMDLELVREQEQDVPPDELCDVGRAKPGTELVRFVKGTALVDRNKRQTLAEATFIPCFKHRGSNYTYVDLEGDGSFAYLSYWNLTSTSHGALLTDNGSVVIQKDGIYEIKAQMATYSYHLDGFRIRLNDTITLAQCVREPADPYDIYRSRLNTCQTSAPYEVLRAGDRISVGSIDFPRGYRFTPWDSFWSIRRIGHIPRERPQGDGPDSTAATHSGNDQT